MWADGFRVCFTPLLGVLFTFPSRYWFAIGLTGVFSLAGWSRPIRAGFRVSRVTQDSTTLTLASRTRLSRPTAPLSSGFRSRAPRVSSWSYYPGDASTTPVWAPPLSLATTRGITVVLFSCGYLDVSVPRVRLPYRDVGHEPDGLPHSETRGSTGICPYPRTIAAYRVLHRLREPRHPPSALSHFPFLSRPSYRQAGRSSRRTSSRRPPAFITSLVVFQHVKDPTRPFRTARGE